MWVDHMVDHFSTYIYQKRGFFYFSRRVPKEVQHCHSMQRIVFALNTRSRAKALKYSQVICQRLDERWLPMRLACIIDDKEDLRGMDSPTAWCAKCETNVELIEASTPLYTEV